MTTGQPRGLGRRDWRKKEEGEHSLSIRSSLFNPQTRTRELLLQLSICTTVLSSRFLDVLSSHQEITQRGEKKKKKTHHQFRNTSQYSVLPWLPITIYFQSLQRAVPYSLLNFYSHIQWERQGGVCLPHLPAKATLKATCSTFLILAKRTFNLRLQIHTSHKTLCETQVLHFSTYAFQFCLNLFVFLANFQRVIN